MSCQETAADPTTRNRIMRCLNPVAEHEGEHHGRAGDGQIVKWGNPVARRLPPGPDRDWFDAYAANDPILIAAARARYSTKLQDAGFPPLVDQLDEDGKR